MDKEQELKKRSEILPENSDVLQRIRLIKSISGKDQKSEKDVR